MKYVLCLADWRDRQPLSKGRHSRFSKKGNTRICMQRAEYPTVGSGWTYSMTKTWNIYHGFQSLGARLQAQEKVPVSVRSETHLLACKVKSVQHFANQWSSSSVKHEICTVAYKLKNDQSCVQNGTNWHACFVLRDEGCQNTVRSAKFVE
jgi:hypothetical protein